MSRDIFEHLGELGVTNPSFIVASGPCGRPHYDQIPAGYFIAAINSAILLPLKFSLWICTTPAAHVLDLPWWPVGLDSGVPSLMRRNPASVPPYGEVPMRNERATYTMRGHSIKRHALPDGADTLDEGASSGGVGIALLHHALLEQFPDGPREIITCGFELMGRAHFDGSVTWHGEGDGWATRREHANKLIRRAAELGTRVRSLSPVHPELELERVPEAEIAGWQEAACS